MGHICIDPAYLDTWKLMDRQLFSSLQLLEAGKTVRWMMAKIPQANCSYAMCVVWRERWCEVKVYWPNLCHRRWLGFCDPHLGDGVEHPLFPEIAVVALYRVGLTFPALTLFIVFLRKNWHFWPSVNYTRTLISRTNVAAWKIVNCSI